MNYNEKLNAIVEAITPVLKSDLDANRYAAGLIEEADDDCDHFEVRGFHTKSGAPFVVSL